MDHTQQAQPQHRQLGNRKELKARFGTASLLPTIFPALIRLHQQMGPQMDEALKQHWPMADQDQRISQAIDRDRPRLRNFIRRRVADPRDAEDILQDVFYELVEANRLLMPIEHVTAWLFRVARNRITDLFRKKRPEPFSALSMRDDDGEPRQFEELLPSPDGGPEAEYFRHVLLEEIDVALDEMPEEQREVFVAHEIEGRSFKQMAAETGINMNTLLARKHYALRHLRKRLRSVYDEFAKVR